MIVYPAKILFPSVSRKEEVPLSSSVSEVRVFVLQELAGYTGGDASFLKEDLELQLNRRLFWDSVSHFKENNEQFHWSFVHFKDNVKSAFVDL